MFELVSKYGIVGLIAGLVIIVLGAIAKRAVNALWDAAARNPAGAKIYGCVAAQAILFIAGMVLFAGNGAPTRADIRNAFRLEFFIIVIGYIPGLEMVDKIADVLKSLIHEVGLAHERIERAREKSTK